MAPLSDQRRGFTLMELLVALGILLMVIAAGTAGFSDYAYRQRFASFVAEVRLGVQEQQQRALGAVGNQSHGVHINATSVVFFTGEAYAPGAAGNRVLNVPEDVSATSALGSGVTDFFFSRRIGTTSASGTISLFDSRSQQAATITISQTGLVQ